jgi:S-adenosylmethionine:tRNA ribosyltransferase-isomerase
MVPGVGLEPTQYFYRGILNPLRLPISPPGQGQKEGFFQGERFCPSLEAYTIADRILWSVKPLKLSDFDYDLPEHLIAQSPAANRTDSRLLRLTGGEIVHGRFTDLAKILRAGDLLVMNDTRVVKARLLATKDSGGSAEVMLERVLLPDENEIGAASYEALCQVRVSKPLKSGRTLQVADSQIECVGRQGEFYHLRFPEPVFDFLERHGQLPLPPYIARGGSEAPEAATDEERYQTVFARHQGAVAAPTAGLHFSEEMLEQLNQQGIGTAFVTLHVGAGTFQPVRHEDLSAHVMHEEYFQIEEDVVTSIEQTKARGGRVVAVGTTVIRTLEGAIAAGGLAAGSGSTRLFITPGFSFQVVDALITNFHLPKSTLMMLVSAFGGYDLVMSAYAKAVGREYRFFSYGDAMFIERARV